MGQTVDVIVTLEYEVERLEHTAQYRVRVAGLSYECSVAISPIESLDRRSEQLLRLCAERALRRRLSEHRY